jgi:hypothetical protein
MSPGSRYLGIKLTSSALQDTETLLVLLSVQFTASEPFLQKPKRLLPHGIRAVGERPQEQDTTGYNKGNKKERATKYQPQHTPHHTTAHHATPHHTTHHSHALLKHLLHILLHCRSRAKSYHIAPTDKEITVATLSL